MNELELGQEVEVELWHDTKAEDYYIARGEVIALAEKHITIKLENGNSIITSYQQVSL